VVTENATSGVLPGLWWMA